MLDTLYLCVHFSPTKGNTHIVLQKKSFAVYLWSLIFSDITKLQFDWHSNG